MMTSTFTTEQKICTERQRTRLMRRSRNFSSFLSRTLASTLWLEHENLPNLVKIDENCYNSAYSADSRSESELNGGKSIQNTYEQLVVRFEDYSYETYARFNYANYRGQERPNDRATDKKTNRPIDRLTDW